MGLFKSSRVANQLLAEYEALSGVSAVQSRQLLDRLTSAYSKTGATTGDVLTVANASLQALDTCDSPQDAREAVRSTYATGAMRTVAGKPMNQFAPISFVDAIFGAVFENLRPEKLAAAERERLKDIEALLAKPLSESGLLSNEAEQLLAERDQLRQNLGMPPTET